MVGPRSFPTGHVGLSDNVKEGRNVEEYLNLDVDSLIGIFCLSLVSTLCDELVHRRGSVVGDDVWVWLCATAGLVLDTLEFFPPSLLSFLLRRFLFVFGPTSFWDTISFYSFLLSVRRA